MSIKTIINNITNYRKSQKEKNNDSLNYNNLEKNYEDLLLKINEFKEIADNYKKKLNEDINSNINPNINPNLKEESEDFYNELIAKVEKLKAIADVYKRETEIIKKNENNLLDVLKINDAFNKAFNAALNNSDKKLKP